jgi:putative ABC transport system permease protein
LTVFSPAGEVSRTVVGVVGKIKYQGLEEAAGPQMYVPYSQDPTNTLYLVIRTASKPEVIARGVRFRVLGLDRNLPVEDMMTMQQRLASLGVLPRFYTSVLGSFAALALILAAVGVYGVMSHVAAQRTHEVGIRFALGASREDILKLVVGQGLRPTLIGVVIGVGGALILTRSLSSLLYGVKPTDPLTFVVVSVILTAVALLASYIPARRATKVDPMVALRYE